MAITTSHVRLTRRVVRVAASFPAAMSRSKSGRAAAHQRVPTEDSGDVDDDTSSSSTSSGDEESNPRSGHASDGARGRHSGKGGGGVTIPAIYKTSTGGAINVGACCLCQGSVADQHRAPTCAVRCPIARLFAPIWVS
eukprot:scaffold259520_cov35-Tisochrysis_lutea.AAC.1